MAMQLASDVGGTMAVIVASGSAVGGIMLWVGQAMLARHTVQSNEKLAALQREHENALALMRAEQDKSLQEIRGQLEAANAELVAIRDHRGHVSKAYFEREVDTYLRTISQLQTLHLKLVALRSELESVLAGGASTERIRDVESRAISFLDESKTVLHLEPAIYVLAPKEIGKLVGTCLTCLSTCAAILLGRDIGEHRLALVDAGLTRISEARDALDEAIRARLQGLKVL